jgi:hypothetical protein
MLAKPRTESLSADQLDEVEKQLLAEQERRAVENKLAHFQPCMSSEHFGQFAWQFERMSGSSGLKVQAAIAC